jgi:hypothetical protein
MTVRKFPMARDRPADLPNIVADMEQAQADQTHISKQVEHAQQQIYLNSQYPKRYWPQE